MRQKTKEKQEEACKLWEKGLKPKEIAKLLDVGVRTVQLWLRPRSLQERFKRDHKIIELLRNKVPVNDISFRLGISERTVHQCQEKYRDLIRAEHYTEEDLRKRMGLDDMIPISDTEEDYKRHIEFKAGDLYGYENVRTEVDLRFHEHSLGKADIVIYSDREKIIEVKCPSHTVSIPQAIQQAIGQLFLASIVFPRAELFIACCQKIPKHFLDALHQLGIKQWPE